MESKPKVTMYYAYSNHIGGPLTYIHTLMQSPLKEKYSFDTCFQDRAPGGINLQLLRDMVVCLKRQHPDLVHVHGAQSEGFYGVLASRLAGCKRVVMTIHGFAFDDSNCKGIKKFLYRYIVEPLSIRMSDQVYCVCQFALERDIVQKNAGAGKARCIYSPAPRLLPRKTREAAREELGFSCEDVVFCITGRITRDKGFAVLEEVVRILAKQGYSRFKLLVVGDGEYAATFRKHMAGEIESGMVVMTGPTTHVADFLIASDGFIFPSFHENLPISLLEAGSFGLPSIVGNVGGNGEIIQNGINGLVLDEISPEKFARAVITLMEEKTLRAEMGKQSLRIIRERFSLETACEKVDDVYAAALGKRPR